MRKVSDQNLENLKIPFFRTWGPLQGSIEKKHNNLYLLSTKRKNLLKPISYLLYTVEVLSFYRISRVGKNR